MNGAPEDRGKRARDAATNALYAGGIGGAAFRNGRRE
jgi:hypothetical protein